MNRVVTGFGSVLRVAVACAVVALVFSISRAQESTERQPVCLPTAFSNGGELCLGVEFDTVAAFELFDEGPDFSAHVSAYGGRLASSPFSFINVGVDTTTNVVTRFLMMRNPALLQDIMGTAFASIVGECRQAYGEDYRIVNSSQKSPDAPIEPIFSWDKDEYAVTLYVSVIADSLKPEAPPRLVPLWFSLEQQPADNLYPDRPDSEIWTRKALGLPENPPE